MSYTVVGLFNNRDQADAAIRELIQRGFVPENIDVSNRVGKNSPNAPVEEVVVTESVANFFHSFFSNDKKNADNYIDAAVRADSIITVHVDDEERAREVSFVLDRNGAIDVDAARLTQQTPQNLAGSAEAAPQNSVPLQNGTTIPIIEEQLQIDKQVIETGGVRVRSRIIEKPIEENVRLRNQFVIVNRRSADREVTNEDLSAFREGEIEFLELAEVPVIAKQARVVEEVEIGTHVTGHEETVQDTLRSTDVEIEEINKNIGSVDINSQR